MKPFISIIIVALLTACQPELTTPTKPGASQPDLAGATVVKEGMFTGIGGHSASGTVTIYELSGMRYIVFDPYSSESGPDLKVYLSKNEQASEYLRLGPLMSTTGRQTYAITGNPDLTQYPFVHIWCERFSVEFARAFLK